MDNIEVLVSEAGAGKIWVESGTPANPGDVVVTNETTARAWAGAGWVELDFGARRKKTGSSVQ